MVISRSGGGFGPPAEPTEAPEPPGALFYYVTTFPTIENPLSESGVWTTRDSYSTDPKILSAGKCVSTQTGTTPPYNDSQAYIHPDLWTDQDVEIEITFEKAGGLDGTNREVEINYGRDDYAEWTPAYGLSTTRGWELNLQHTGSYCVIGRFKEADELGRVSGGISTPTNGDRLKLRIVWVAGKPTFRVYYNGIAKVWDISSGVGSSLSDSNFLLTDDRSSPHTGNAPGLGFYRTTGDPEQFWITKFEAWVIDFLTTFSATENPLSESAAWVNGLATGLQWNNMQSGSGNAYGTAFIPSGFADNCAVLSQDFGDDYYIEGVVHRAASYNPSTVHELELLVRASIAANVVRGYEILMDSAGGSDVIRWNGDPGDFDTGLATSGAVGAIADGDVIRATVIGSTITVYKNSVQVMQATGITFSDGQPGIGVFTRGDDGVLASFGWKSIMVGRL